MPAGGGVAYGPSLCTHLQFEFPTGLSPKASQLSLSEQNLVECSLVLSISKIMRRNKHATPLAQSSYLVRSLANAVDLVSCPAEC